MRTVPTFIMGLACAMASPAIAQTSANNPRLKQLLQQFPQADANRDGVLTLQEAFVFGRQAGVIPGGNVPGGGVPAAEPQPKQNPADIQASPFGKWKVFKDVQYDTKHERNVLDFYQADSETPTPVVVYFHGGGFRAGDKANATRGQRKLLEKFLEAGISVASCNYPFLEDAHYMAIMQHCGRSIQFIRSRYKEWNIDPTRFGAYGDSAGALISEWVAYSPDVAQRSSKDPVGRLTKSVVVVGAHLQPTGTEAMVLRFMKPGGPPLFIYSNSPPSDKIHDPKYSKSIKEHADKLGIPAVLVGGGRNDIPRPPNNADPFDLQVEFFAKYLVKKAPAAQEKHAHFRKWTDKTGKFSLEAKLIAVDQQRVQLQQQDGRVTDVPIDALSRADRRWLQANGKHFTKEPSP